MGQYRGKTYFYVGTKQFLLSRFSNAVNAEKTHIIVRLPDNNPDVKMKKGRYALLKK